MTFEVYRTTPYTEKVGKVLSNGQVINIRSTILGRVYSDGSIKERSGKTLGRVNSNRTFSGEDDMSKYRIDRGGNVFCGHDQIGSVMRVERGLSDELAQWAACVLLLAPEAVEKSIVETQITPQKELLRMIREARKEAAERIEQHGEMVGEKLLER